MTCIFSDYFTDGKECIHDLECKECEVREEIFGVVAVLLDDEQKGADHD